MVRGCPSEGRAHRRDQLCAVRESIGVAPEPWVVGEFGQTAATRALGELPVVAHRDHEVTVGSGEGLVRDDIRMRRPETPRHRSAHQVIHRLVGQPRNLAVVQRYFDRLPAAAARALEQGRHDRAGRVHAAHDIGDGDADFLRFAALLLCSAGNAHQAAGCLDHCVVARLAAPYAVACERRDAADDQSGVCLPQALRVQSPARQRAGLEVLDDHVGFAGQFPHEFLPCRRREVHGQGALVAIGGQEVGRFTASSGAGLRQPGRAPVPRVVTCARSFDLDDVGAVIAEQLGGPGAGQNS